MANGIQTSIELKQLTFAYPEQAAFALKDVTLSVGKGELLVLCGPSGCGKSTLLRQLKTVLAPHGVRTGSILFEGMPLEELSQQEQAGRIGFVLQSPDNQIVTDKVWHELAFGLESLGYDTPTIRRRVAEMASFFGIQNWFYKSVNELSGGQKQLLNLASVMAMQPDLLILDEPTSQLDPIAASDFLATVGKINRELGTTILLTEHRLEDAFSLASRVAVLDGGRLLCVGTPQEVGASLKERGHDMFLAMPTAMRVWASVESDFPCPVTVGEGRSWLLRFAEAHTLETLPPEPQRSYSGGNAVEAEELWFKYEKESLDIVKGLSITVKKGELMALLGGNGAGKTTSLKLMAGLLKPYRGAIRLHGTVGMLPQNPQALFVKKTVREDLYELLPKQDADRDVKVARAVKLCRLEELLERHPYDLSGGEQQRAALAKVLLLDPEILLMDEPTKGLDAEFKEAFAEIMQTLLRRGVTILMVSHDVEFCAQYAHRCALFFDGGVVAEGTPRAFFSGNNFYTTSANRMARGVLPQAVTAEELTVACGGSLPPRRMFPEDDELPLPPPEEASAAAKPQKLPLWRKLIAAVSGAAAVTLFFQAVLGTDLKTLIGANGLSPTAGPQLLLYALFLLSLFIFSFAIGRRSKPPIMLQPPKEERKLAKRTLLAAVLILLLIPLTLFVGVHYFGGRRYYFTALLVLLECMLPFFLVFEGRRPKAREMMVVAVLCALGVAGRAVFFMLPQFKPVMALTIIAGVAFGGETGFLVGAVTMLASNVMFSQGPWTPWQMFAMGIIGFLAGVLFRKGLLRRGRLSLAIFGALCAIIVYGGIVNASSALVWSTDLGWKILLTYYVTGFPMDCVHAAGTALFLWVGAEPMLEKLDRIKVKYGLVE
ncbi:MAG: ATP-binding cassette domain-containing protein [Oscillospiraceae bacterium]|nr:ATP-binding cassette domain-containing protein [Oscillospiraceae bacterium]